MSLIGQVVNINQNMHIPAHIIAEHLASVKFSEEFVRIAAKEKNDKVPKIKKVEKSQEIDERNAKQEEKERVKHIDLKA